MSKHSEHSSFREKLIEHLFVGEMLKLSWKHGNCQLEVLKPEVDNSGYDVVIEDNNIIRHIQLKASYKGAKTSTQKIHTQLAQKPSGCMVWIVFDENSLELCSFYYFGAKAGKPLPSLENAKIAKHTRANSKGEKAERANIRNLNKGQFTHYDNLDDLYNVLFVPNSYLLTS